ncbi:MAG: MerR family DNA-binding protein [Chloroflexota bacterium]
MLGRNAGFSLAEIASMVSSGAPKVDREQLLQKAMQLDKTIKQLEALRDGLQHAAACPASSHFECPKFQKLVRVAIKHQRRKQSRRKEKL